MNHCCEMGCDNDAEYEIWSGHTPDDFTHSCSKHIADLMFEDSVTVCRMEPINGGTDDPA